MTVAGVVFLVVALVLTGVVVAYGHVYKSQHSSDGRPALGAYAAGVYEAFSCVAEGHDCARFDDARKQLGVMAPSFTYTPVGKHAPGVVDGDGNRTVNDTKDLSDKQWVAVADSVMIGGKVDLAMVQPEKFTVDGSQVQFTGPGGVVGVLDFQYTGDASAPDSVTLTAVTYQEK